MDPNKLIELIKGFTNVPGDVNALLNTVLKFIDLAKKTPQENHDDLLKRMHEEAMQFQQTGRGKWE